MDIKKRIEQTQKKFEGKEINTDKMLKDTKNNKPVIDNDKRTFTYEGNVYTFEELYDMYLDNENFRGKIADMENIAKYFQLAKLANELKEKCNDITEMVFLKPEKNSRWASIHIDFLWMVMFNKEHMDIIQEMLDISDDFSINGSSFSAVRLSFGINNIWEK